MKSLTSLWSCMADELAMRCYTSAARDKTTVMRRTEHEGLSFLAITLADLGKATQTWLERGFVDTSECPAFHKAGPRNRLPAFLQGFYCRVFSTASGALLSDFDIEAIYAIRQLTLAFSKIALPEMPLVGVSLRDRDRKVVSPARERRAMLEFLQCEQDVRASDERLDPAYLADFQRMSEMLFGDVFAKVDRDVHWGRLVPKHGPGAVAERLSSNAKFASRIWTARLEKAGLASSEYLFANPRSFEGRDSDPIHLEPDAETPVRVVTVPKTLKTPRVIAIEPAAMQYVQQALGRALRAAIEEDGFLSDVVGHDDQAPNQELARQGSLSGDLATLDLSEASDRVSNQLVRAMLDGYPQLLGAVEASRSRKADVPGHGVIRLAKFASMGSALTFPVEEMVFVTLIFLGIERELSAPLSRKQLIKLFTGRVRVFGDDLIVPVDYVLSVIQELETFGFRVNLGKSFWTGRFRESCGKEFYDGQDVSIVKVRRILPASRQDARGVISAVAFRNLAYWAGLWRTAAWMDDYLGRLIPLPNVAPSSPLLGRESALGYQFQRLDPKTFSPLTKGYYKRSRAPFDPLDGEGALLKCLLQEAPILWGSPGLPAKAKPWPLVIDVANVDDEHLERTGRPEHVSIKLGWKPPY